MFQINLRNNDAEHIMISYFTKNCTKIANNLDVIMFLSLLKIYDFVVTRLQSDNDDILFLVGMRWVSMRIISSDWKLHRT